MLEYNPLREMTAFGARAIDCRTLQGFMNLFGSLIGVRCEKSAGVNLSMIMFCMNFGRLLAIHMERIVTLFKHFSSCIKA